MTEYLTQTTLLRLLAILTLVIAPHALHQPAWESLLIAAIIAWRAMVTLRQWHLPPAWLRAALVVIATGGIYASFRSISGLSAGTALLCVMASLKLLEMRARRDVMVMVMMMYFILVTHFLFSQELWTILYLLFSTCAITALLMDCNHAGEPLLLKPLARRSAIMVAQALPIMLIFFVLFPRIPGPLWGLPTDTGASRSGLSDKMSPGDISNLMLSDEIAFRVHFLGAAPPPNERYWRGPVLDLFDGRGWEPMFRAQDVAPPAAEFSGSPVNYEITLEPHQQRWLFALDLPSAEKLPADSILLGRYQLMATKPVRDRLLYQVTSYPHYVLEKELDPRLRRLNLVVRSNPKTRELALAWRQEGLNDEQIVQRSLQTFRSEAFYYTLKPPLLGSDPIDDFLFSTRKGFCEHYASSFTFLMRAAGIPARIVTGYQGGERNALGDYYVIHQYDAHAWSEVWLEGRGWVRVDPTAAVAPDRVEKENGLASSMGAADGLPAFLERRSPFFISITARWDWVNDRWNRWVLAYGPDLQAEFLRNFGIQDYSDMILALTIGTTLLLSIIGLSLLRQFAPVNNEDLALKLWRRAGRQLAHAGYRQRTEEGPQDFVARVKTARPDLAESLDVLLAAYLRLRYLEEPDRAAEMALINAVKLIKP